MRTARLQRRWAAGLAAVSLAAAAPVGNSGAAEPDLMLNAIPTYPTEREAEAACAAGRGGVVWAERYAGYYFRRDEPQYGTAPSGAYACAADAAGANYWDSDPMSGMMTYHGKSFPSALREFGS